MRFGAKDITEDLAQMLIVTARRPELVHDGFYVDGITLERNIALAYSQHPNEPAGVRYALAVYATIDWTKLREEEQVPVERAPAEDRGDIQRPPQRGDSVDDSRAWNLLVTAIVNGDARSMNVLIAILVISLATAVRVFIR